MPAAIKNVSPSFISAFDTFYAGAAKIRDDYMKEHFALNPKESFSITDGSRYVRVVNSSEGGGSRSVWCFVDKTNGDVLKADSWKAPAKHARGNIFDAKNGLGSMGPYGPASLR